MIRTSCNLAIAVVVALAAPVDAAAKDPAFAFLTASEVLTRPDGSLHSELCIAGAHPPDLPVLLLSRDGPRTCEFRTSRQVYRVVGDGP